jgi:hypothetical protein
MASLRGGVFTYLRIWTIVELRKAFRPAAWVGPESHPARFALLRERAREFEQIYVVTLRRQNFSI